MESGISNGKLSALILHLDRDTAILLRERLKFSQQSLTDDRPKIQAILDAIDTYLQSHLGENDATSSR